MPKPPDPMPPRHESAWIAHTGAPSFASLGPETEIDVLVVGAGITGLTAAHALHEAGVRVGVVEARRVGQGVTGYSTGHMTRLLDARYHHIRAHFGDGAAGVVAEAAGEAMARIERNAERYGIDAGCRRLPAYLYGEDAAQRAEVEREREAARASGVALDNADALPIPGRFRVAVREADALAFDPYAYAVGLARALRDAGVPIAEQTRVLEVRPGETPEVETTAGRLRAGRIVLATHTPLGLSPLQTLAYPYRSYVLGLHLPGGGYPDALVYDAADPYHYVRSAQLDGEPLLVVGGADHKTGELDADVDPYSRVERWARERWPDAEVRYRWSAEVFEPADRLPLVGADPLRENVLVATGFSGDGLVWGPIAGGLLAALARGASHPLADVLKPTRLKPGAGWRDFLKENVDVGVRFVADRLARDVARAEEIAPGEGGLLFEDGRHIAAYRDDEGTLHRMSPVCTHMGCVVRWNAPDAMWECPCHGARYDARGAVVSGPATRGLEADAKG